MSTTQILPGTLELLILRAVSFGSLHGYGVLRRIELLSSCAILIEEGALYPALWRLERQDLVSAVWGTSENNRKAKFYSITPKGKARLGEQVAAWDRLVDAMDLVLGKKVTA